MTQEWISTGRLLMQSRDDLCCPALIACHVHVAEEMPPHEGAQGAPRSITWRTLHTCRESNSQVLIPPCRKGIWLKLPLKHAQLVPVATSWGFYPHHAGASLPPSTFLLHACKRADTWALRSSSMFLGRFVSSADTVDAASDGILVVPLP